MLPWIFVIFVLVNAGLFLWGYQRDKTLEPSRTPVPEGSYEIRLVGEAREGPQRDAEDSNDKATRDVARSRGLP